MINGPKVDQKWTRNGQKNGQKWTKIDSSLRNSSLLYQIVIEWTWTQLILQDIMRQKILQCVNIQKLNMYIYN